VCFSKDLHNPLTESKTNVPVIVPPPNFIGKNTDLLSQPSGSDGGSKIYNYTNSFNSFSIFNCHKPVPFRSSYSPLNRFEHDNVYNCLSINDISISPSIAAEQSRIPSVNMQKCDTSVKRPTNAHIFNRLNNYKRIQFVSLFNGQNPDPTRTFGEVPTVQNRHKNISSDDDDDDDGVELTESGITLSKRLLSQDTNNPIHQKRRKHGNANSNEKCAFNNPTPAYILGNEEKCIVMNKKNGNDERLFLNNVIFSIYQIESDRHIDKIRLSNKKYDICRVQHSASSLFSIMNLVLIDLPDILAPSHIVDPSLRVVIARTMQHLYENKKPWLLKAFKTILNIHKLIEMKEYIGNLFKIGTPGTKMETLMFSYIYNCELFISFTDENNVYSCISTSDIFNTLEIQIDRVVDHTAHIAVGIRQMRNGRIGKRYLYFREQKIPIRLEHVSSKDRVQIMNTILKISTGTAKLYYKKICIAERKAYLAKSKASMRNLQKAQKLLQI